MVQKSVPFTAEQLKGLMRDNPTPFYIYEEKGIREAAQRLNKAFAWAPGFKEYFAVKALPNPHILSILKDEGCGMDCSSLPELMLAEQVGISGENIMFSSNDTPAEEFVKAKALGAIINLDDVNHLDYLEKHAGIPEMISFRYSPGQQQYGNDIIGNPKESKFGITREQLLEGYKRAKEKGVKRFGLHSMPISNELNPKYFIEAAHELFSHAREIQEHLGIAFEFINLGGGIGIHYRDEKEFDIEALSKGVHKMYDEIFGTLSIKIFVEYGRYVTGPYGYLVSTVRHVKESYKRYVGLDACMANLMRPAMYGAYHHITVLGKENIPANEVYDVVGSLCENNDKFAIGRQLPPIEQGDVLIMHDAGAHGHTMGFNYNGKLRSAEFLMRPDGTFKMIRRAETVDDLFVTLVD